MALLVKRTPRAATCLVEYDSENRASVLGISLRAADLSVAVSQFATDTSLPIRLTM